MDDPLIAWLFLCFMNISERELEDFIFEDLRNNFGLSLKKRGLRVRSIELIELEFPVTVKWLRQVNLGEYGILDIVGYFRSSNSIYIELFELKNVPIESDHFNQILRYKKGIEQYFGRKFDLNIHCYLVGSDFNNGHYIHNYIDKFTVVEFTYNLDGISFSSHAGDWYRTNSEDFDALKSLKNAEAIHGY